MADEKNFDAKIEDLANALADKALGNLPPDKELVDCFKALAGYYSSSRKVRQPEAPESTSGFGDIKRRIAAAGTGEEGEEDAARKTDKPAH